MLLQTNNSEISVFKYRGGNFERDLKSLKEDYFWAPTLENLNDPYEGMYKKDSLNNQIILLDDALKKINKSFKNNIDTFLNFISSRGIYSLSRTQYNSILWSHYADSHRGFCVEYDLNKLLKLDKKTYEVIEVDYVSVMPELNLSDLITSEMNIALILKKMIGTKSKEWGYEQEVRIITSVIEKQFYDFRALKCIYFGCNMNEKEKLIIMKTLKGRGIKYYDMKMTQNNYQLITEEKIDLNHNAQNYINNQAIILKDSVNIECFNVDKRYKKFVHYLIRAAEIIRKEPYCSEIVDVNFSTKGSVDNPIIYINYKYQNKYFKEVFTLGELDNLLQEE